MDLDLCFLIDAPTALDAGADAASSWVQIAKVGSFNDPRYGDFKITKQDFGKWIRNFDQFALADGHLGLPIDCDHSPEKRGETEAVGWIKQLEQRGDQLWARAEWNALGKQLIAERRYAYISPSYVPNFKDEKGQAHGTAILGVALTNRPFLQMATVNLSAFTFAAKHKAPASNGGDDVGLDPSDSTDLDDLMLDVSDTARQKHAVVVKRIDGKTKHMFPIPPGDEVHARAALDLLPRSIAAGHITEEEAAAIRRRAHSVLGTPNDGDGDEGKQHSSYSHRQMELTQVLTALNVSLSDLGVAEDADEPTVLAALATHQAKETPKTPEIPEGHVVLSQEVVTKLTADATLGAAAAEELRVNKFETAFLSAQQNGKVVLAQKDLMREVFDKDPDTALKLLDGLQPVVNMTPQGVGGSPSDLNAETAALAKEYTDEVTPMAVDPDGLKVLAAAEAIERERKIPFEQALVLAEQGMTV